MDGYVLVFLAIAGPLVQLAHILGLVDGVEIVKAAAGTGGVVAAACGALLAALLTLIVGRRRVAIGRRS